MIYLRRGISIFEIIAVTFVIFYLYLPAQVGPIDTMNTTVGEERLDVSHALWYKSYSII